MGDWKLVVPVGTTNYVLNPSSETTGNWGSNGGTGVTVSQSTTYAFRGLYSYKIVQAGANANTGMYASMKALTNAIHYLTFWVRGTFGTLAAMLWEAGGDATGNLGSVTPALISTEGDWYQYGVQVPAATANTADRVYIIQTTAAEATFYVDCVQVEPLTYWTTYCDGDQPGCKWSGARHGSTSYRWDSREGGAVRDLVTYYGLSSVQAVMGYGGPTKETMLEPLAFVDGSVYQGTRASGRILQLECKIKGTSLANYYSKRKALLLACNRHHSPQEPCLWYYTGAGKTVALRAFVESGDEGGLIEANFEKFTLNLMAVEDPYWEELREETTPLTREQTIAVEQMVAYRPSQAWNATTGYWDALGAPEMDADTTTIVYAFAKDKAGNLYVGGRFLNLNGTPAADYIAKRDVNGTWSALSNGTGGIVQALACDASGNLYVGGLFVDLGDASGDCIVMWNGSAWSSLGSGAGGGIPAIFAICVGLDGTVYAGGQSENIGGVGAADFIAKWSGGAWSALHATAPDNTVFDIVLGLDGDIFATGEFTTVGGVTVNYVAKYDVSAATWSALGAGLDARARSLSVGPDGRLYVGGDFHTAGGVSCAHIAVWDGIAWAALGSGVNDIVYRVVADKDGRVHAAGKFTSAGGVSIADRCAVWNGTSWSALPIDLPGSATVYALLADGNDIYLGFDTEGNATAAGISTTGANGWVTNSGTAPANPHITVACTDAACTLQEITNHTTGQVLRFNRAMQVGEVIFINTTKGQENVMSSFPYPNGSIVPLVMPSDLGNFCLLPGGNYVSCYAPGTGATVTTTMRWRIKHDGMEGGAT